MKRIITAVSAAAAFMTLGGCVTAKFQQFEGRPGESRIEEGYGGTKEIVDAVEIWATGTPPRRYQVLGVATLEGPGGPAVASEYGKSIAKEVKAQGGHAAILMDSVGGESSSAGGVIFGGRRPLFVSGGGSSNKTARYTVVRYMDGDKPAAALPPSKICRKSGFGATATEICS